MHRARPTTGQESPSGRAAVTAAERLAMGSAAGALALAVLWAINRLDRGIPFAPLNLAERIIRATPGGVATFFIEHLQHNAIRLVAAANVVAFVALAALIPALARGRFDRRAYLPGALFGLAVGAAALTAPAPAPSIPGSLAAVAIAGGLYGATLAWLLTAVPRALARETDLPRRRAFGYAASVTLAFALGGTLLDRLVRRGPGDVAVRAPDRPARIPARPPFPEIPGLSSEITSAADHYVVDIDLDKPLVDPDSWTLKIRGAVEHPLELGFTELEQRFELAEEYSVLTCISNEVGGPLIGNSRWEGVRLHDVLQLAGIRPQAVDLIFRCADGYTVAIPVERAADPHAILAIAQNGRALRTEHGFPCRVRIPSLYGMMNAKWLEQIEVVEHGFEGYWAQRGWSDVGLVRTESRIDTVAPAAQAGNPSWIAGVAWAGERGISRVEVSVDGGATWRPALLREPLSPVAWRQWAYRWTPGKSGSAQIACRATDGQGALQDSRARPPHPSGASGYHTVAIDVA